MPTRCIAGYCDSTPSNTISLHSFPPHTDVRLETWVEFVHVYRPDWGGDTTRAHLCSKHFDWDSFENWQRCNMRMCKRLILKDNAVPTVQVKSYFPRLVKEKDETAKHAKNNKRARKRLSKVCFNCGFYIQLEQPLIR